MIFPLPWGVHDPVRCLALATHLLPNSPSAPLSQAICVGRKYTSTNMSFPGVVSPSSPIHCTGFVVQWYICWFLKEPCTRQRSDDQLRTSLVLFMHMLSTGTRSIKTTTTTSEPSRPFVLPAFLSFLSTTVFLCQFGLPLLPHKRDLDISIHTYRLPRSPLYQTPWSIHSYSRLRP